MWRLVLKIPDLSGSFGVRYMGSHEFPSVFQGRGPFVRSGTMPGHMSSFDFMRYSPLAKSGPQLFSRVLEGGQAILTMAHVEFKGRTIDVHGQRLLGWGVWMVISLYGL